MLKTLRAFVWTMTFLAAVLATLAGQTADKPDQVSRKVRFRGGDDPNITAGSEMNVRNKRAGATPAERPPAGHTPCAITFDNQTDLFTKTYIDGVYAGTIRPFGALTAPATAGAAMLYARAEYEDGSADAWGPIRASCNTKYLWRLTD
jgi:hypothetical protein